MKSQKIDILIGIVVLLSGLKMYKYQWDHLYGFPVTRPAAALVCLVGIFFVLYGIFRKGTSEEIKNKMMECSECGERYKRIHVKVFRCPECNGELVFAKDNDINNNAS